MEVNKQYQEFKLGIILYIIISNCKMRDAIKQFKTLRTENLKGDIRRRSVSFKSSRRNMEGRITR
jgi:hypothetical protein